MCVRKLIFCFAVVFVIAAGRIYASGSRWEKLSDHCYYMSPGAGAENIGTVVTEEGILLINPPVERSLAASVWDALKDITSQARVRWIAFTDPRYVLTAGAHYYAERKAVFLASSPLHRLAMAAMNKGSGGATLHASSSEDTISGKLTGPAWFIFGNEIKLFPSNIEIRICAVKSGAHTAGDVFVHVPAEKVLFVGRMYAGAQYPEVDIELGGDAAGWIEGIRQVIESVPVLKSAIPKTKPGVKTEEEKSAEEQIVVVPACGRVSNLQEMKELLETCQKLQSEVSRATKRGRSCASFLASQTSAPFRIYANLDSYACKLFDSVASEGKTKQPAGLK